MDLRDPAEYLAMETGAARNIALGLIFAAERLPPMPGLPASFRRLEIHRPGWLALRRLPRH